MDSQALEPVYTRTFTETTDAVAFQAEVQRQLAELVDDSAYAAFVERVRWIKDFQAGVSDYFKDIKANAHKAWQGICEKERAALAPAKADEALGKAVIAAYLDAQEQRALLAQREAEAQARRDAESDVIEQAAALEREAVEFGDAGQLAEAQALLEQPVERPMVAAPAVAVRPVSHGVSRSVPHVCVVDDLKLLAAAVGAGTAPIEYIEPAQKVLDKVANALPSGFNVPGCRAVRSSSSVRIRR